MRRAGGKVSRGRWDLRSPASLWRRLKEEAAILGDLLGQLLSPGLRRTSLLLSFVWFGCAIVYYGLVLLVTTVRRASPGP